MLKPVQRLPQYRLLLEDYLKHLDPDGDDFDDTTAALRIVSEVAEQADNTIKQGVRSPFFNKQALGFWIEKIVYNLLMLMISWLTLAFTLFSLSI
jgi:hypothetical protein